MGLKVPSLGGNAAGDVMGTWNRKWTELRCRWGLGAPDRGFAGAWDAASSPVTVEKSSQAGGRWPWLGLDSEGVSVV